MSNRKPIGMEHQTLGYAVIKMPHEIITLHQEAFPQLKEKMRYNPDATKVYAAFLTILALKAADKLTPTSRDKILEVFKQ